jgi:2-keto-4-pentenoate hydratase/2-oxohepta-3-ene-1,7-dioic acid hydratase in catechol pathway
LENIATPEWPDPPNFLQDGDLVEVEIEGIGMLKSPVLRNE